MDAHLPAGDALFDRVILDMLAPWECVPDAATALIGGGLICCYVATTTQLARVVAAAPSVRALCTTWRTRSPTRKRLTWKKPPRLIGPRHG